jgi:acylglycerol lipase
VKAASEGVLYDEQRHPSADGTSLNLASWAPDGPVSATVLVVPGYADHANRYRELGHTFARLGLRTVALDLRGHGHSAGRRGHLDRFDHYLADVDAAAQALGEKFFLLGHSMGGLVALDWVTRRPEGSVRGLIVTNPFVELGAPVPPFKLKIGELAGKLWPTLALPSGIDPAGISRDLAIVEAYRRDPLVFTTATAGWFREITVAHARVRALASVDMPLLYIHSDADRVVSSAAHAALGAQLASPDKTVWLRAGEYHEVLNELDRKTLHADIAQWIKARSR